MENIIDYMEQNKEVMIDWVYEFFSGKYSKEEIDNYCYGLTDGHNVRFSVRKLAEEFTSIENKNTNSIRDWYTNTDFYVFDLLPYNGGPMFKEKADEIVRFIKENNIQSVLDFGGGLGVMAMYIKQNTQCKVYYCDLKDGITYSFAKFLMNKFNMSDIETLGDTEFFNSNLVVDCILATDCFEHIPNMEEVFGKLTNHSFKIFHDSTFYSNEIFPQHVYTPKQLDFLNMCALYNYLPNNNNMKLLNRVYLQISDKGHLTINTL